MKYIKNLTDDEIRKIFTMRSKGMSFLSISEKVGISATPVREILIRRLRSDVEIPDNILEKVANAPRATPKPRTNGVRKSSDSLEVALATYTASCVRITESKKRCIALGINSDTLELLREAVRDRV